MYFVFVQLNWMQPSKSHSCVSIIQTIKVFYHRWKSIALLKLLFSVLGINYIFYIIAIAIDYLMHKALWYTPLQASVTCYRTISQNSNQSPAHLIFDSVLSSTSCELWDCLQLHMNPRDTMILINRFLLKGSTVLWLNVLLEETI